MPHGHVREPRALEGVHCVGGAAYAVFAYYEWVAPFVGSGYRDGAFGFAPAWSASLLHALRCGRVSCERGSRERTMVHVLSD